MSTTLAKTSADALPEDDWGTRLTKQVARAVNYYRREMGLTTKALAQLCTIAARDSEHPREVKPTTLNNFFAGKRKSVGLDEVILFARVLGIPPVALMVPVGIEDRSEAWPGTVDDPVAAFDALVGATRWGSVFDDALAALPDLGEGDASAEHRATFDESREAASDRAHELTRLLLDHGRLERKLSEHLVLFHDSVVRTGGVDWSAAVSVIRRRAGALRAARERLRSLGINLEPLRSVASWIDVVDPNDLDDEELRAVVQQAVNTNDQLRVIVKDKRDGPP